MIAKLKSYRDRVDAMSLRERVLIFVMLAAVLVSLVMTSVIDPLSAKQKQLSQALVQSQAQTQALESQVQALAEAARHDPDAANKQRLAALDAQRKNAYAELANVQQGLVAPDRMTQVLRDLLNQNARLKLVSIKTLPAAPLIEDGKPAEPGAKPEKAQGKKPVASLGLYRHGVEISVEGNYADLVAYLALLEKMPWHVYWGDVSLTAREYPNSRLTLTLYTLSLDKTWLSV